MTDNGHLPLLFTTLANTLAKYPNVVCLFPMRTEAEGNITVVTVMLPSGS